MQALLRDRFVRAWAVLVGVTLLSSQIGGAGGWGMAAGTSAVTAAVLGIAFAKVGVVMSSFMDVRHAPVALRLICATWLTLVFGIMLLAYGGVLYGLA
jgi:hypothetical protein